MSRNLRIAIASGVLLLPALILVVSGVLRLEVPAWLIHPVLVMGGVLLVFALNALVVLGMRVGLDQGVLSGTISVRVRGNATNLATLVLSFLLFALIAGYMFVENFQLR